MTYTFHPAYPTPAHAQAAQVVRDYFQQLPETEAVLLTCSCARGKASPDSCLDVDILLNAALEPARRAEIEAAWEAFALHEPAFFSLHAVGKFAHVDLSFSQGQFAPGEHGWTSGADDFELSIGNLVAYSVPLWERGSAYQDLRARWLPYYAEELRQSRLEMVLKYCRNNLEHIPLYVRRGLYFQSFQRLWLAFGEYLQALFISRRTYPIAYDKWVREQIVDILGRPDLYPRLPRLFELQHFESAELAQKAQMLSELVDEI